MKKYPKLWLLFGFILQGKLAICVKKFRSFEIVQDVGKNSKTYKEVENGSKH